MAVGVVNVGGLACNLDKRYCANVNLLLAYFHFPVCSRVHAS
jgi:hypothetical protein